MIPYLFELLTIQLFFFLQSNLKICSKWIDEISSSEDWGSKGMMVPKFADSSAFRA